MFGKTLFRLSNKAYFLFKVFLLWQRQGAQFLLSLQPKPIFVDRMLSVTSFDHSFCRLCSFKKAYKAFPSK